MSRRKYTKYWERNQVFDFFLDFLNHDFFIKYHFFNFYVSMKTLIRQGSKGPAILRVTLLNEGSDAYLPELYGDRITVERTIMKSGGGGYKMLSADNRVRIIIKIFIISL